MRTARLALACVAALALAALPARADVDKPVHLLVGFAPGGSADIAARLIAERINDDLHQPVVVENRPGAGGRLVADTVKNAPADGSVLMLTPIVVTVLAPMVFSKVSYDPVADFAPVAQVANFQFALSVNASHPARTMQELLAWYRANPSKANFGSPAAGSLPHFFGVMIARGTGIDLVHVPYNGGGPMMNALIGGDQITAAIDTLVEQLELHRGGRVRILATSGSKRSPLVPDVPT
ncbi:MAG: ABC transporter substrate-binding protein, partial [Rhizobacter sp.]|nr:ABC transporter substrate-binding protein [Rhizobacter sp.]